MKDFPVLENTFIFFVYICINNKHKKKRHKKQIPMRSKALLTFGLAVMTGIYAFGQDTTEAKKIERTEKYTVQTNLFGSNWFVGAGIGVQMYFGDNFKAGNAGKLITPTFEINVGKWFTPGIGVRFGFGGNQAKSYSTGSSPFAYKHVESNLYRTKWGMLHLHGDMMFNLTNMFCGYKEDRLYNAIPYLSLGYIRNLDSHDNELSGGVGFINRFRVSKAWDVNLELKATLNNDVIDGIRSDKNAEGSAAIMVGAAYRFNRRDWSKGTGVSMAEMQRVQSQLKNMNEENAALRDRINNLEEEKKNAQPVVLEKPDNKLQDATEYVAFFDINKAYLNEKEAVNLEAYANLIKKYPENTFCITGYADKQTGSAEYNEQLSKQRAEAVYNTLVDKYGVNANQLKMEHKGGVDTMFRNNSRLSRAAVIRMVK